MVNVMNGNVFGKRIHHFLHFLHQRTSLQTLEHGLELVTRGHPTLASVGAQTALTPTGEKASGQAVSGTLGSLD